MAIELPLTEPRQMARSLQKLALVDPLSRKKELVALNPRLIIEGKHTYIYIYIHIDNYIYILIIIYIYIYINNYIYIYTSGNSTIALLHFFSDN